MANRVDDFEQPLLSKQLSMSRPSVVKRQEWKPVLNKSYETLCLANTESNPKIRPAGFRSNGEMRQIKNTCLLGKIRTRCQIRQRNPKMAVCITMYNEDESQLMATLAGVMHNYNCLRMDEKTKFTKDDMLVVLICDGYERIPESFRKLARDKQFLDEQLLAARGFMTQDKDGTLKMKPISDLMQQGVPDHKVPTNLLHLFQLTSFDFGLKDNSLCSHRINFMFGLKHRNDGKINSHKWFF